jgi:hypothetical protein
MRLQALRAVPEYVQCLNSARLNRVMLLKNKLTVTILLGIASMLCVASPALGQDQDPAKTWRDPDVRWAKTETPYLPWLAAALFTAAIAAVSFKHPRRGPNA